MMGAGPPGLPRGGVGYRAATTFHGPRCRAHAQCARGVRRRRWRRRHRHGRRRQDGSLRVLSGSRVELARGSRHPRRDGAGVRHSRSSASSPKMSSRSSQAATPTSSRPAATRRRCSSPRTAFPTVTIGKYNKAKDIVVVAADKPYKTFADLPQGLQGRRRVVQRVHDRVAGPGEGPRRAHARRKSGRPPDGASPTSTSHPSWCVKGDLCAGVDFGLQRHPVPDERTGEGPVRQQVRVAALRRAVRAGPRGDDQQQLHRARRATTTLTPRRSPSSSRCGSAAWTSGPPTRTRSSLPTQTTSGTPTRRNSTS